MCSWAAALWSSPNLRLDLLLSHPGTAASACTYQSAAAWHVVCSVIGQTCKAHQYSILTDFVLASTPRSCYHAHCHQKKSAACSRKTLIYLILTLNHCYPDYDFSLLRAHHFRKEPGVAAVEEAVDSHLLEVSKVSPSSPRLRALNPRPLDLCLLQSAAGLRPANMDPSSPAGAPGIVTQCCSAREVKEEPHILQWMASPCRARQ